MHRSDREEASATPQAIANAAVAHGCKSVAFTYNDPRIFVEYAMDIADACHAQGVSTVAVTAGYIHAAPRADFYASIDAANVDLEGFSPEFYRELTGARLEVVLETLEYLVHETQVWTEITTLVIPGHRVVQGLNEKRRPSAGAFARVIGPTIGPNY